MIPFRTRKSVDKCVESPGSRLTSLKSDTCGESYKFVFSFSSSPTPKISKNPVLWSASTHVANDDLRASGKREIKKTSKTLLRSSRIATKPHEISKTSILPDLPVQMVACESEARDDAPCDCRLFSFTILQYKLAVFQKYTCLATPRLLVTGGSIRLHTRECERTREIEGKKRGRFQRIHGDGIRGSKTCLITGPDGVEQGFHSPTGWDGTVFPSRRIGP